MREIQAEFGYRSPHTPKFHVDRLVEAGYLRREPGHRGLRLAESKGLRLAGMVAAGPPIEAIEEQEERIDLGGFSDDDHFALLVRGDSMIEECIADGDHVIVRKQATCEDGDVFDIAHRPVAYAVSRPLTLCVQHLLALAVTALGCLLVWAVLRGAVGLTELGVSMWSGSLRTAIADGSTAGVRTIVPAALTTVFCLSCLHTAWTSVYLYVREACDGRARDEVAVFTRPAG